MHKQCKYVNCSVEVIGRQVYCSDKCRMSYNRTKRTVEPEQTKANSQSEHYPEPPTFKDKAGGIARIMSRAWVLSRSRSELRRILDDWRLNMGTEYQRRLGELAAFYEPGKYKKLEQLEAERALEQVDAYVVDATLIPAEDCSYSITQATGATN